MKNIIYLTLLIIAGLSFTGCGAKSNLVAGQPVKEFKENRGHGSCYGKVVFTDLEDNNLMKDATIIKAFNKVHGKSNSPGSIVADTMHKINAEVKKRGYKYYQVIAPAYISNVNGFPIKDAETLQAFISPLGTSPKATYLHQHQHQNVVSIPLFVFSDSEAVVAVTMLKEEDVTFDMSVWDVDDIRNAY